MSRFRRMNYCVCVLNYFPCFGEIGARHSMPRRNLSDISHMTIAHDHHERSKDILFVSLGQATANRPS
jgi:hypothetical protein